MRHYNKQLIKNKFQILVKMALISAIKQKISKLAADLLFRQPTRANYLIQANVVFLHLKLLSGVNLAMRHKTSRPTCLKLQKIIHKRKTLAIHIECAHHIEFRIPQEIRKVLATNPLGKKVHISIKNSLRAKLYKKRKPRFR